MATNTITMTTAMIVQMSLPGMRSSRADCITASAAEMCIRDRSRIVYGQRLWEWACRAVEQRSRRSRQENAVMLPRRKPIDIEAVETRLVSAADAGLRGDVHCAVVQGIVVLQSVYARRTQPRKYPLRVDCGQRTYDLQ